MNVSQNTLDEKNWLFGPNWTGKRCGARTRRGTTCQKPALNGKTRCQLHGALGGAPEGSRNGNFKSGRFTKKAIANQREARRRLQELILLGKSVGMFN